MEERQNADGTLSGIREASTTATNFVNEVYRVGGYAGPAGTNNPAAPGGGFLDFNIAGGTDTAGGLLAWKNNLGYDIIVTAHILDVTTVAAAACTVAFGSASASTTLSTNMINGLDVHTTTTTSNGGALSVKVAAGNFITGSKGGGASASLIANAIFSYVQSRQPSAP